MAGEWVSARAILAAAAPAYDEEWQAVRAIARRAASGALRTRALVLITDDFDDRRPFDNDADEWSEKRNCEVDKRFWSVFLESVNDLRSSVQDDWVLGDITVRRVYRRADGVDRAYLEYVATGIQFFRDDVPFELEPPAMPMAPLLGISETSDIEDCRVDSDAKGPGGKQTPAWGVAATVALKLVANPRAMIERETQASIGAMIKVEYEALGKPAPNPKNLERWGGEILKAVLAARTADGPRLAVSRVSSEVSQVSRDIRRA